MADASHEDPHDGVQVEDVQRRLTISQSAAGAGKNGVVHEGFLVKQGGNFKSWKRRYFVMTSDSIAYLDKKDGNVKGGILMESIEAVLDLNADPKMKETAFSIVTPARTFIQHAGTKGEKDEWIAKIKSQVEALKSADGADTEAVASGAAQGRDALKKALEGQPPFILRYFEMSGRSTMIISMLEDAGVKYEYNSDNQDFIYNGGNKGFASFAVPVLEHGDFVLGQSIAIMQYLGKVLGYIPQSDKDQAHCAQVALNCVDFGTEGQSKASDEGANEWLSGRALRWLDILDKELSATSDAPFFFGNEPVYADFVLYGILEILDWKFGSKMAELPAGLKVWQSLMLDRPNMKAFNTSGKKKPIFPSPAAEGSRVAAMIAGTSGPTSILEKIGEIKKSHPDNLAIKFFDVDYYNSLDDEGKAGLLQCINSGVENPDSGMGCYAMQPADYDRFKPFFSKVLAGYHKVAEDAKHVNNWSLDGVEGLPENGKLDLAELGLPTLSMRVRVGRNLKEFPLPGAMTKEDRIKMEEKMCAAFDKLIAMPEFGGGYNSLTPEHKNFIDQDQYQKLVDEHIMFKDMAADSYLAAAGIASDWPYGRGCYVSEDRGFVIWVGEEDHLRIMCMKKATVLNEVFDRLKAALDVVNSIEGLEFAFSDDYGVVTSCPTNLGTGMRASVHIPIPNLTADGTDKKAKEICKPLGLSVRGTGGEHTPIGKDGTCDISPSARFCITEAQIITALYNGLKLLKEEEAKAGSQ